MHVIDTLFVTIIAAGLIVNEWRSKAFSQKNPLDSTSSRCFCSDRACLEGELFRLERRITAHRDDKRCDACCPNMGQRTFFAIGLRNKNGRYLGKYIQIPKGHSFGIFCVYPNAE